MLTPQEKPVDDDNVTGALLSSHGSHEPIAVVGGSLMSEVGEVNSCVLSDADIYDVPAQRDGVAVEQVGGVTKPLPPGGAQASNRELEATTDSSPVRQEAKPGWLRRNLLKLSVGAFAGTTAVMAATGSLGHMEEDIVHNAPWTGLGVAASEATFTVGAVLMAIGAGQKVGNPFTIRRRFAEILENSARNPIFRVGLAINTLGALGTAGVLGAGAVTSLPPETWPGILGVAGSDAISTVGLRSTAYAVMKNANDGRSTVVGERSNTPRVNVRRAELGDIEQIVDLDETRFNGAYGESMPSREQRRDMFVRRMNNAGGWMLLAEIDGEVDGFVTAFRTDKPLEEFVSWEDSTAEGTLDGRVAPEGRYAYIANMTASRLTEAPLLANLLAEGIKAGLEYGYFVARMPGFSKWAARRRQRGEEVTTQKLAEEYIDVRRTKDGKRLDGQLRMYENAGFELVRLVSDGFQDAASLNYGVVFKANIPPNGFVKRIGVARKLLAGALKQVAKHPKLLKRVF